jgi:hypothetical protein
MDRKAEPSFRGVKGFIMTEYVTNRLHFITNTEAILKFIKSKHVHDSPPPEFSFNSIKPMPDDLFMPMNEQVLSLSVLNLEKSSLDEATKEAVLSRVSAEALPGISAASEIPAGIDAVRKVLEEASTNEADMALFERAVSNYATHGFFSHFDWRLVNWGTTGDVQSIDISTFHPPTSFIEFTTRWTPPVAVVQILANTFPSVRFKLKYRFNPDEPWITRDIFAFPPFGY